MPLPLAPIALFALRGSAVAATLWAVRSGYRAMTWPGRTDQRAEDAMDDLDEGIAVHRPVVQDENGPAARQTNSAVRLRRVIRWGDRTVELDAAFMARFRIRQK